MSKKWYGSISNRIEEGHNYNEDKKIHVGDDITMYYYSDRTCYYVTKVINQKHIFVHRYEVCADHSKPGGIGHEDWLYFKTIREEKAYLNSCHLKDLDGNEYPPEDLDSIQECSDEEWVFRYGKWRQAMRYNLKGWEHAKELAKKDCKPDASEESKYNLARYYFGRLSEEEFNQVMEGKEIVKYYEIQPVSFGVRDYYFDWEY